jgi:putative transposase
MEKAYLSIMVHVMFSTESEMKLIKPWMETRLYAYIEATARRFGVTVVAIGGTEDHLHMLLKCPPNLSLGFIMQKLKGISSKWINGAFYRRQRIFKWQKGYTAFSVGYEDKTRIIRYINTQKERHRQMSYSEEHQQLLEKSQIYHKRFFPVKMGTFKPEE